MKFDERKIYHRILQGDEFALKELMDHYKTSFYSWATHSFDSLNHSEYEDAFAEATIQFYEKVMEGQFEYRNLSKTIDTDEGYANSSSTINTQNSKIKTYLFHLAKNRLINELSKKKVRRDHQVKVGLFMSNNSLRTNSDELIVSKERSAIVKKMLENLPTKYKEILILSFFKNYSMDSIANELDLSNADVAKSTKYKAIKKLYNLIKSTYKLEDFSLEK